MISTAIFNIKYLEYLSNMYYLTKIFLLKIVLLKFLRDEEKEKNLPD